MKTVLKNTLLSLIVIALCFAILEIGWRIKMSVAAKDSSYMFYGQNYFVLKLKGISNRIHNKLHKENAVGGDGLILTYGGSTTQCIEIKREDSWPGRLGYRLNVTIKNYAALANLLSEQLGKYEEYFRHDNEKPDLVIFYFGINDSSVIALNPGEREQDVSFFAILNCRLMDTSLLYASIKEKYFLLRKNDINAAWKVKSAGVKQDLELLEKNINKVISLSNYFDTELIMCLVPISHVYFYKFKSVEAVHRDLAEIMEKSCKKSKVHFINVHKEIFIKHNDFDKYYLDGVHLDEKGNDLIAQFLADYIMENHII